MPMTLDNSIPVRRLALFSGLSDDESRVVLGFMKQRLLAAGEVLCMEGEVMDALFIPVRGRLEILTPSPRRTVATVEPGDMLGLDCLLTRQPQTMCFRATTDTMVLELGHDDFAQIAAAPGTLGIRVVHQTVKHLARQLRTIDEVLDRWDVPPPPVVPATRREARAPAAPEPVAAAPEPAPAPAPRKRKKGAASETDEQLLDRIREYSQKAGLGDLDRIRVARSGDQMIKPPGYDSVRRR
jgi:CRP-like cAMP-binding protein